MKQITLGWESRENPYHVLVDDADYELLNSFNWHVYKHGHTFYARRLKDGKPVFMHREILGLTDPKILTDHEDHNGLNNQRSNLRALQIIHRVILTEDQKEVFQNTRAYAGIKKGKNGEHISALMVCDQISDILKEKLMLLLHIIMQLKNCIESSPI